MNQYIHLHDVRTRYIDLTTAIILWNKILLHQIKAVNINNNDDNDDYNDDIDFKDNNICDITIWYTIINEEMMILKR